MDTVKLKIPVSNEDHSQGDEAALITLVEYGDYECPYCAKAYFAVKRVQRHFNEQLRFVFRNFPLAQIHPHAEMAAESAEFAASKGLFWQMHDLIYENQRYLSPGKLIELGDTLQLTVEDLELAIQQHSFQSKIKKDFLGGARSGVNGTPTFFINEVRYNGSFEFEDLIAAIDSIFTK